LTDRTDSRSPSARTETAKAVDPVEDGIDSQASRSPASEAHENEIVTLKLEAANTRIARFARQAHQAVSPSKVIGGQRVHGRLRYAGELDHRLALTYTDV